MPGWVVGWLFGAVDCWLTEKCSYDNVNDNNNNIIVSINTGKQSTSVAMANNEL